MFCTQQSHVSDKKVQRLLELKLANQWHLRVRVREIKIPESAGNKKKWLFYLHKHFILSAFALSTLKLTTFQIKMLILMFFDKKNQGLIKDQNLTPVLQSFSRAFNMHANPAFLSWRFCRGENFKRTYMAGDNEYKNHGSKDTGTLAEKEVHLLGCSLSWTSLEEDTLI